MLATGRINSITSKWIFNYKEVIWIEGQWLFLSTSELESRDLGLTLPKLANSMMRNAENFLGDCYYFFSVDFNLDSPIMFLRQVKKEEYTEWREVSHM